MWILHDIGVEKWAGSIPGPFFFPETGEVMGFFVVRFDGKTTGEVIA
jgi:hypothetical protein